MLYNQTLIHKGVHIDGSPRMLKKYNYDASQQLYNIVTGESNPWSFKIKNKINIAYA